MASLLENESVRAFDEKVDAVADLLRGNPVADRVFYSLSQAANHSVLWHSLSLVVAALGGPDARRRSRMIASTLAVEAALVNGPLKLAFERERPSNEAMRPHELREPLTSSFPSGHASAATCFVVVSGARGRLRFALVVLAALVSWSRVHVNIHHGSDIVGGIAAGAMIGWLANRIMGRADRQQIP